MAFRSPQLVPDQWPSSRKTTSSKCRELVCGKLRTRVFNHSHELQPQGVFPSPSFFMVTKQMLDQKGEKRGQILRNPVIRLASWDCSCSGLFFIGPKLPAFPSLSFPESLSLPVREPRYWHTSFLQKSKADSEPHRSQ